MTFANNIHKFPDLPPCKAFGVCDTLVVYFDDGELMSMPYFGREGAISFLELCDDMIGYEIVPYTGMGSHLL